MLDEADVTIIGAGVVGLAIAAEVSNGKRTVFVLEKNRTFGQETSSRNSQVIHSGLYYPERSLKAKTCVTGNRLLYQICADNGIGHKRLGKLVVATREQECGKLLALMEKGQENGVANLQLMSQAAMRKLEPNVSGKAALFVQDSGIINVHELMKYFVQRAKNGGAEIIYRSGVLAIERLAGGYHVVVTSGGEEYAFLSRVVINAAGLSADKVAFMAGIDVDACGYRIHYCKGDYFRLSERTNSVVSRLVYPVPSDRMEGLGIHITIDLDGRIRLGPDARYVEKVTYEVDTHSLQLFYQATKRILPLVTSNDLEPEMAGIRPKLQGPGDEVRDFVVSHEETKGYPGLINLIGIESPGLTASPALAGMVGEMVDNIL